MSVFHRQDYGDVICLTELERSIASTSILIVDSYLVSDIPYIRDYFVITLYYIGAFSFSVSVVFTLHTEPRINPPEFTVAYRSQGGPVTAVFWTVNDETLDENAINKSLLILDTSNNSVYENRLRVRGRTSGRYSCQIFVFRQNSLRPYKKTFTTVIEGMQFKILDLLFNELFIVADQEPTNLAAVVSEPNCSTVNISVSWEPPVNTPTGYVIYYQQKGGEVMSEKVDKSHADRHTLNDLQRGVTYNISIVALSHHLPSLLVGPVTVFQGICEIFMYSF